MANIDNRQLFILRRACLLTRVTRAEVMREFDVSGVTAKKDMEAAVAHWPGYLEYLPSHGVRAKLFAHPPEEACSTTFLSLLHNAAPPYALGLTRYETVCAVNAPRFAYQGPEDRSMVMTLFKACVTKAAVDIEYVGLRIGETRKTRTVLPLGLELLGHQWRVIAHDVDVRKKQIGAEQKFFVLARILNAQVNSALQGRKLKDHNGHRTDCRNLRIDRTERDYQVIPNRRLTPDQVEAVAREFALVRKGSSYVIRMPERNMVEFKRDHCTHSAAPDGSHELKDFVLPVFEGIFPYAPQ